MVETSSLSSAGPSSNWAKLQQSLPKPSEVSRKGKEPTRSVSGSSERSAKRAKRSLVNGVAAFARNTLASDEAGPSRVVDVPVPVMVEGVVFHPLPCDNPSIVELREMVAGRNPLNENRKQLGNYISIDCEMVGLGHMGSESALARVSLVNYHGHVILDTFVQPRERVTDWRTWVSGVSEKDLIGAPTFDEVQKKVAGIADGRILVGHAIENDLKALFIDHPGPMIRDTQKCKMLREKAKSKRPGLKKLSEIELGLGIQRGAHSSVTDARATMALYRLHKAEWEKQLRPTMEAWRAKTGRGPEGKRKRGDNEGGEEGEGEAEEVGKNRKREPQSFPGGGRKGVSSGLGLIIKRNGVRIDKRRGPEGAVESKDNAGEGSAGNWWEKSAG